METYTEKLKRLLKKPTWKRLLFSFITTAMLFENVAVEYCLHLLFKFVWARSMAYRFASRQAHWVGGKNSGHRIEIIVLAVVLLYGAFRAPTAVMSIYWAAIWGSLISVLLISRSIVLFTRRFMAQRRANHQY